MAHPDDLLVGVLDKRDFFLALEKVRDFAHLSINGGGAWDLAGGDEQGNLLGFAWRRTMHSENVESETKCLRWHQARRRCRAGDHLRAG